MQVKKLKEALDKLIILDLDENELHKLKDTFQLLELKKGDLFQKEGQWCDRVGILVSGDMYSFSIDDTGEEKVHNFYYPDELFIVIDYESYYQKKKSCVSIKCLENSFLFVIGIEKAISLYKDYPHFFQFEKTIIEQSFRTAVQKIQILQSSSNVDKIKILHTHFPKIFKYFPYSYIASYLGIHRNTVNRILKKI